jgi:hypothetical protein
MSSNTRLSIVVALIVFALGSAAYASDASEIYGGDAAGRGSAISVAPGNWGASYVAHHKGRGVDAYASERSNGHGPYYAAPFTPEDPTMYAIEHHIPVPDKTSPGIYPTFPTR